MNMIGGNLSLRSSLPTAIKIKTVIQIIHSCLGFDFVHFFLATCFHLMISFGLMSIAECRSDVSRANL